MKKFFRKTSSENKFKENAFKRESNFLNEIK